MIRNFTLLFVCILFFLNTNSSISRAPLAPNEPISTQFLLDNSNTGRRFIFAIPANETETASSNALEIYVASRYDTKVTLKNAQGLNVAKFCKAGETVTFSSKTGDINSKDIEIRTYGKVVNKAVTIEADQPVSVYVLNAKPVSSEGFLVLPVEVLGNEYINCAYYDFNESRQWAAGFIVTGAYDNTKIIIKLKGKGKEYGKTKDGKKIGYTYTKILNKGDVFCVEGDGKTRGQFDLTGSVIKSDKPVSVVSYHQRCMIPAHIVTTGRDHLSEMIMPISSWGKEYVTVELNRGRDKGDFFRILASEDNTVVNVNWYDRRTRKLIGSRKDLTLEKKGDFVEILDQAGNNGELESIRGSSIFTSDKPILVMQYSYSANWDNAHGNYDPFMFQVSSTDQYIPAAIFQTPQNASYTENYLNVVAKIDKEDATDIEIREHLESLAIDGTPIYLKDSKFLGNNIPNTKYYWARLKITPGMHQVTGDGVALFSGYIYGFSSYDSYGWPAGVAINKVNADDGIISSVKENSAPDLGKYVFNVTDEYISGVEIVDELNNINLKYEANGKLIDHGQTGSDKYFDRYPLITKLQLNFDVIDKSKNASVKFLVRDLVGNYEIREIKYDAPKSELSLFGTNKYIANAKVGVKFNLKPEMRSTVDGQTDVLSIDFKLKESFKLKSKPTVPFSVKKDEMIQLDVDFLATTEGKHTDSLIVTTKKNRYAWPFVASAHYPVIKTQNLIFDDLVINSKSFKKVEITNDSPVDLIISEIKIKDGNQFTFNKDIAIKLPLVIKPMARVLLGLVDFKPQKEGSFTDELIIVSDAKADTRIGLIARAVSSVNEEVMRRDGYTMSNTLSSGMLNVTYSVGNLTATTLDIKNILGENVATIVDNKNELGQKTVSYNVSSLESGVYFIRLVTNRYVITRRFVISR